MRRPLYLTGEFPENRISGKFTLLSRITLFEGWCRMSLFP
jgi:hypothetical protein